MFPLPRVTFWRVIHVPTTRTFKIFLKTHICLGLIVSLVKSVKLLKFELLSVVFIVHSASVAERFYLVQTTNVGKQMDDADLSVSLNTKYFR